jgi:hypothetical protein
MIPHIPQTTTDTELRSAIMEGNLPTLLVVLNHLGEDDGLLEVGEQPSRGTIDGVHRISDASQTAIRERTFSALKKLRDGTIELPHLPDEDRLQQLASLLVGESVPPEYIPMLLEDMGFNDYAERTDQASTDPQAFRIQNGFPPSLLVAECQVSAWQSISPDWDSLIPLLKRTLAQVFGMLVTVYCLLNIFSRKQSILLKCIPSHINPP